MGKQRRSAYANTQHGKTRIDDRTDRRRFAPVLDGTAILCNDDQPVLRENRRSDIIDLDDVGSEPLMEEIKLDSAIAEQLVKLANEETKRLEAESKQSKGKDIMTEQTKVTEKEGQSNRK